MGSGFKSRGAHQGNNRQPPSETHVFTGVSAGGSHNSWKSSNRRKDPSGWKAPRQVIITRAQGQCEQTLHSLDLPGTTQRCGYPGKDVDHIINLAAGGTDHLDNLQLLCHWHHNQKTQAEASKNKIRRTERHPGERHPGIIES